MATWNKHNPNNPFECCNKCAARHPGCHDKCEAYLKAKKIKAEQKRKESLEAALGRAELTRPIRNAKKK